jgi:hypothetical protein
MAEQNKQRFDTLAALGDRGLAVMTDELAADLSERPSQVCAPHCGDRDEPGLGHLAMESSRG